MRTLIDELYGQRYIKSSGDVYTVEFELAGFSKKDVSITIEDDVLYVATKKSDKKQKRFSVSLNKQVSIPDITSKMSNGLLTVTMPKKEVAKPIEIKIQ